jgi:hypothetical protein
VQGSGYYESEVETGAVTLELEMNTTESASSQVVC